MGRHAFASRIEPGGYPSLSANHRFEFTERTKRKSFVTSQACVKRKRFSLQDSRAEYDRRYIKIWLCIGRTSTYYSILQGMPWRDSPTLLVVWDLIWKTDICNVIESQKSRIPCSQDKSFALYGSEELKNNRDKKMSRSRPSDKKPQITNNNQDSISWKRWELHRTSNSEKEDCGLHARWLPH